MESSKLALKFFAVDPSALGADEMAPVFHSWIQGRVVPDHMLIDVADYAHVVNGPGTVLVSHEANFYIDRGEGRPGLMYVRKQPLPGPFGERLRAVFRATLDGCQRLEQHPRLRGRVRFGTDEVVFRINDRLLAPNTPETFAEVKPELEALLSELYAGPAATLEHRPSALEMFEVRIKAAPSPDVQALLNRLPVPAAHS